MLVKHSNWTREGEIGFVYEEKKYDIAKKHLIPKALQVLTYYTELNDTRDLAGRIACDALVCPVVLGEDTGDR